MSEHKPRTRREICTKAGRVSATKKRERLRTIREVALHNDPSLAKLPRAKFERIVKAACRLIEADAAIRKAVGTVDPARMSELVGELGRIFEGAA